MSRLYANENFPLPVVEGLRRLGHDVLTSYDSGHAGQATPDEAVLDFASAERRVLVTLNRKHFVRLHHERPGHAGIIVCTFDSDFAALASRIHAALMSQPILDGQLVRVNRPGQPGASGGHTSA
jgi:predicted nuclease of predicted toxin-antitoxin system